MPVYLVCAGYPIIPTNILRSPGSGALRCISIRQPSQPSLRPIKFALANPSSKSQRKSQPVLLPQKLWWQDDDKRTSMSHLSQLTIVQVSSANVGHHRCSRIYKGSASIKHWPSAASCYSYYSSCCPSPITRSMIDSATPTLAAFF